MSDPGSMPPPAAPVFSEGPELPEVPEVSVCIATYRRPRRLAELLALLARRVPGPFPFEVVVVDNDHERSAAPVILAARRRWPSLPLRAHWEPVQSIARARNRAVNAARGVWLAFIDDDERPSAGWLERLLLTAVRHGSDGVLGPVVPRLPPGAPVWLGRGGFFDRPRHATGAPLPPGELRTSNLLVRRVLLEDFATASGHDAAARARDPGLGPFDPRFGLSGGEDTVLLGALARRGARFVWSDEAVVTELVPRARAEARYLLRRAYSEGNRYGRWRLLEGQDAAPELLVRGGGGLLVGAALALLSWPMGRHRSLRHACTAAAGLGKLAALGGRRDELYR